MDSRRFDQLAAALGTAGTRRGLLALLATLPVLGGLFALLEVDDAEAKGRRKRRKKRHKHGKGRRRKHHKKCQADSKAKTCSGKCGPVKNNCKKTVDCGSCDCNPTCEVCFTCQGEPGNCVQDAPGTPCGDSGQVCQNDGTCVCVPDCTGKVCGSDGCEGTCAPGCPPLNTCSSDGTSCDCNFTPCGGACCASGEDCCGSDCADLQTDPTHCGDCATACGGGAICQAGECGVVCGSDFCPAATEICDGTTCRACDVCAEAGCVTTVQAAIDAAASGETVYICAGTYGRQGTNRVAQINGKDLTLVGAGIGAGGTILDGGDVSTSNMVFSVYQSTAELRNLTVRGSNGNAGIVTILPSALTLTGVLVTLNDRPGGYGGGIFNNDRVILNAGTSVTGNSAGSGGGINNYDADSHLTLNAGSSVTNNTVSGSNPSGIRNAGTVVANPGSVVEGCVNVDGGSGCPA